MKMTAEKRSETINEICEFLNVSREAFLVHLPVNSIETAVKKWADDDPVAVSHAVGFEMIKATNNNLSIA